MEARASQPRWMVVLTSVALAALVACSRSAAESRGASAHQPSSGGAAGPPSERARAVPAPPTGHTAAAPGGAGGASDVECRADADCILAPWPLPEAPCCDAPYTAVQARSAVEARAAERNASAACKAFDCKAALRRFGGGPPPAPPAKCYFEPRCRHGRCGPAC